MAKGDHSDLFMIFVDAGGNQIYGECAATISPAANDKVAQKMLQDFVQTGKEYRRKVIEIEKFSMSAAYDRKSAADIRKEIEKANAKKSTVKNAKPTPPMTPAAMAAEIDKRLTAQNSGPRVKNISFTRSIDRASKDFMTNIKMGVGYQRASLIKRKAAGGKSAGEAYIRIDFEQILVTSVDWQDDDEVTEDIKFICQKIKIQYRPQLLNGTLGAPVPGEWSFFDQNNMS